MRKKISNWLLSIIAGLILLFIWSRFIDFSEFVSYFYKFDLTLVIVSSLMYVLAYLLRSIRWQIIMQPIVKLSILDSFAIFMAGLFINYLIPVRAGDIAKSVILKFKQSIHISLSLPTVLIDKIMDLFPIIIILVMLPLITIAMDARLYIIIIGLFLIFLAFIAFLYYSTNHKEKASKFLLFFLHFIPHKYREKFAFFFRNFVAGMAIMQHRKKHTFFVILLTVASVLSEAVYIYAVFRAFGAEVSYLTILFGYTLMNLTYILPTPPAQIGSNQFMWVLIFSIALGINENLTGAAVIFSHLLTTIWIFLIGTLSLIFLKTNIKEVITNKVSLIKE